MPTYAEAMLVLSRRALLESAASAIRLGIAPPNPSPVRNRAAVSEGIAGAKDVRRERQPKAMSDTTSTTLRPNRSARRPPTMAPSRRPAPLAAKKAERLIGVGCSCRLKPPAATPAACTSNPSHSAPRKQRPTVSAAVPGLRSSPIANLPGQTELWLLPLACGHRKPAPSSVALRSRSSRTAYEAMMSKCRIHLKGSGGTERERRRPGGG